MYTNEQLQSLIKGEVIGTSYPYDTKNDEEVESYMKQLSDRIKRIPNIICEVEWDHFGSGYASFIEFFCYRKEDILANKDKEKYGILECIKPGILINMSRLAPVFIYGEDERHETIRLHTNEVIGGGYSPLPGHTKIFHVREEFDGLLYQLVQILKEFGYEQLDEKYAYESLPFEADIPTLYRENNEYRKLDAIFYWED